MSLDAIMSEAWGPTFLSLEEYSKPAVSSPGLRGSMGPMSLNQVLNTTWQSGRDLG